MDRSLDQSQKADLIEELVAFENFDVNFCSQSESSSLYKAVLRGQSDVIQVLLNSGAKISDLKYYRFADFVDQDTQENILYNLKDTLYLNYFWNNNYLTEENINDSYLGILAPEIVFRIASYCEDDMSLLGDAG
jgi:hypothetical protein